MDKFNDEELLRKYYLGHFMGDKREKARDELLSRLNQGRRAIQAMEKIIIYLPLLNNQPITWKEQAGLTYAIEEGKQTIFPLCTYDCDRCGKTYQDVLYPDNPQHCCYCFDCRTKADHEKESV